MGFNKIYIDFDKIISEWKEYGAQGVADMYQKYDGVIMTDKQSMVFGRIMEKEISNKEKNNLIEVYIEQLLEGLHKIN
jgi:hypothetical protein|tara:strand:- start:18214 stop:18447 length:234 start_codon:yes stop_codon:yes gene_type:complete